MRFISLDNRGLQPVSKHTSKYMQAMNVTSNTIWQTEIILNIIALFYIISHFAKDW